MPKYDKCPVCGGRKRSIAKTCKACSGAIINRTKRRVKDINYDTITSEWLAEFRGLFWGEGSAMIVPNSNSYGVILTINLREDDRAVIEDIRNHLGGSFIYQPKKNKKHGDQYKWKVTRLVDAKQICEWLLQDSLIPAKKREDVQAVLDFINWRLTLSRYLTDEQRQEMADRAEALRKSREL